MHSDCLQTHDSLDKPTSVTFPEDMVVLKHKTIPSFDNAVADGSHSNLMTVTSVSAAFCGLLQWTEQYLATTLCESNEKYALIITSVK